MFKKKILKLLNSQYQNCQKAGGLDFKMIKNLIVTVKKECRYNKIIKKSINFKNLNI